MRTTELGDLQVSVIGLGCMGMSQAYGEADRDESERTLHRALDLGITFLDTANIYGRGHNETLIGEVLKERRNEIVLATKFGIVASEKDRAIDGSSEAVAARCDESLQRLQTDHIDLYYLHRLDPNVPIEDTVGAMSRLVEAGKVRYLGLSEVSARTLRSAHAVHPITAVQSEYSLWTRDPEAHVLAACRELNVGFVPFSPLGRAILTGTVESGTFAKGDMRGGLPRFQGDNFDANLRVIAELADFAAAKSCTPGQLALAWLLAQGEGIAPIPGTKRRIYLEENALAVELELSAQDLERVALIVAPERIQGERYATSAMRSVDKD
jgi:aryl-alcohol dehydrogenase-like predicted oxidoreductase